MSRHAMAIREILVVHHTHTDIGYTHPQPVIWELQRRFIEDALDLCEATADLDEASRVRWTCEVTAPVVHWLRGASSASIERFRALATAGQISVAAALCNMTPLYDAEQLVRSLRPVRELRARLDVPIRLAIQHDVNGVAWPLCGLLREIGVGTLMVGINTHFGCFPLERPLLFRWAGPDGQELTVINAEHYHSFDRWLEPHSGSTARMQTGLERYLATLPESWTHDFIVLSATHFDFVDNNPPSPVMADAVRRWNAEGRSPLIRFVTSDQLAERVERERAQLPVHRGDWPDAWNFGCASTARETRINRRSKLRLETADALHALSERSPAGFAESATRAWFDVSMYDEHTWGSWGSTWNTEADDLPSQLCHKLSYAYEGRSWTGFVLREAMDAFCENPRTARGADGLLLFNSAPVERTEILRLRTNLATGRWEHYPGRIHNLEMEPQYCITDDEERVLGPVTIGPFGARTVRLSELEEIAPAEPLASGAALESPWYELEYDPKTGRVLKLVDRELGRDVLDGASDESLFGWVRETVDPERHSGVAKYHTRDALFETDFEKLSVEMRSGWKPDWPARRERSSAPESIGASRGALGATLAQRWGAVPGATDLRVEITLAQHRKALLVDVAFRKTEFIDAEGIYFTVPLSLREWRAHYDTAGQVAELDAEQLPGAMRDYLTVGGFVAVHDADICVVLASPDAPMVQVGDFWFGKCHERVPRERCLLLPWPLNNYWDTNFPPSQPGFQRFHFELTTSARFDVAEAFRFASHAAPLECHPVVEERESREWPWITLDNEAVFLVGLDRSSKSGDELLLRLSNPTAEAQSVGVELPGLDVTSACRATPLGEDREALSVASGRVTVRLPARSLVCTRLAIERRSR